MTVVDDRPDTPAVAPRRRPNWLLALLRNSWRQLTSMRTALVLLLLLAVAAIPGSVLPQRGVNPGDVRDLFVAHPDLAVLPRDVGQPRDGWFAAGCGVGPVVLVVMQPGGQGLPSGCFG